MNLLRRLLRIERHQNVRNDITLLAIWGGTNQELWKERIEKASRKGCMLRLIRLGVTDAAYTKEEAESIVAKHRAVKGETFPVTVYDRNNTDEVLACWDPGLPAWLEEAIDRRRS